MIATRFTPNATSHLVGSLPLTDHLAAHQLMLEHTPEIPLWIQLPCFPEEGMILQFLSGFPGLKEKKGSFYIETNTSFFEQEMLSFYEEYLQFSSDLELLSKSRFAFTSHQSPGFFILQETLKANTFPRPPIAIKGQITGPFTFATSISDELKRAIFYDSQLRDIAIKLVATKARWQTRVLAQYGYPIIMYLDEPALTGFGSSEYISISKEDVQKSLSEVITAIHEEDGLAGIHICGNTDWSLILSLEVDIINFDAYSYMDRFLLYADEIALFLKKGGIIAWGIVPTLDIDQIEQETVSSLFEKLIDGMNSLAGKTGVLIAQIIAQSLITPSCGLGSQTVAGANRVLELLKGVSTKIR